MYEYQTVDRDTFNKHLQTMQAINRVEENKIYNDTSAQYGYFWNGKFIPVMEVCDAFSENARYHIDFDEFHKALIRMTP